MKKNERGAALAYTLLTMLVVSSMCALLLTLALSQTQNTRIDKRNLDREIFTMQIGEFFRGEGGKYESTGGEPSSFKTKLMGYGFEIQENANDEWLVTKEENAFLLRFTSGSAPKITVESPSGDSVYLSVELNGDGQITKWTKGER